MAAAAQGKFWEIYDVLYARQTQQLDIAALVAMAKSLGLDATAFRHDLETRRYQVLVDRDRAEANALGVHVTPTFFVNGKKIEGFVSTPTLKRTVDEELRKVDPSAVRQAAAGEQRAAGIDTGNAPLRGTPGASVQIIEFSDMQCPFCARQVEVLKQLVAAYPGKVSWYFKSFPLSFHPDSPLAHRALLAANAQGKFWEMHDQIFANQKSIKRNDMIRYAAEIGLDIARFNTDLDNNALQAMIDKDRLEGERLGVSGTPSLFVNGRPLTGVRTFAELQSVIEDELRIGPQGGAISVASKSTETFDLSRGPEDAPVTITWFTDLSSPLTADSDQLLKSLQSTYPKEIKVVFKNRPVATYSQAELVHQGAIAAAAQGKFWEMEQKLVALKKRPARADLLAIAHELGLDEKKFTSALDTGEYRDAVARDILDARRLDVRGSPVFFVNSIRLDGVQTLRKMQEVVESELRRKRQESLRASTSMSNAETSLPVRDTKSGQARTAEVESK